MLLGIAFGLFVVAPSMLRGGLSWAPHVSDVWRVFRHPQPSTSATAVLNLEPLGPQLVRTC